MNALQTTIFGTVLKSKTLTSLSSKVGKLVYTGKTYAPEFYLVTGIVTGVVAAVTAVKAHNRQEELDEITEQIEQTREDLNAEEYDEPPTTRERAMAMAPLYGEYVGRFVTIYGMPMLLGGTSITFILTSYGIIKGRNSALIATAKLIQTGFDEYRQRVKEEYGDEEDQRLYYGAEKKTIVNVVKDKEGKKKKVKTTTNVIPDQLSPAALYGRIFDSSNPEFNRDKSMNRFRLETAQQYMNDMLLAKGYFLLNDAYDALNMPRSPEGAIVGWSLNIAGDDYVDIGIDNPINNDPADNRFVLDFNVNGVMYHLIDC
jgi:hypothetical protein